MTDELGALLHKAEFPLSQKHDTAWMLENQMGPNAIWLMEWLLEKMALKPGQRVLDLGCGRAMTSIFLAKEVGAQVYAADLWIAPEKNWQRIQEAGMADQICPVQVESHALPFAPGFFDAVVSIDAFQYFATDVLYLGYLSRFVRAGGQIGVVVPGLMQPLEEEVPGHLLEPQSNGNAFWEPDCWSFETAAAWQRRWRRCDKVEQAQADTMPDGWRHWRDFESALEISGKANFPSCAEALERDAGRYIGFIRAVARRNEREAENFYRPNLANAYGVDV